MASSLETSRFKTFDAFALAGTVMRNPIAAISSLETLLSAEFSSGTFLGSILEFPPECFIWNQESEKWQREPRGPFVNSFPPIIILFIKIHSAVFQKKNKKTKYTQAQN